MSLADLRCTSHKGCSKSGELLERIKRLHLASRLPGWGACQSEYNTNRSILGPISQSGGVEPCAYSVRVSDCVLDLGAAERTFWIRVYEKLSAHFFNAEGKFWAFWATHLISRLQLNHVPVHKPQSAKVRNYERHLRRNGWPAQLGHTTSSRVR